MKTDNLDRDNKKNEDRLFSTALMLNTKVMGFSLGLVLGLGLFIATNWLVLKGGNTVGPHLQLLSQYFIGYRVSFLGSIIGFAYGFTVGTLSGSIIGFIYNKIAMFRS
jgi:ABC-type dipeptide/oligopeptide/nickel transport system permease subunit